MKEMNIHGHIDCIKKRFVNETVWWKKIKLIEKECCSFDTSIFLNKKIKLTDYYLDWLKTNGIEIGVSYEEIQFSLNDPIGEIKSVRYDGIVDGFIFNVFFPDLDKTILFGIEDIKII